MEDEDQPMMQRVLVTHGRMNLNDRLDPLAVHSEYVRVFRTYLMDTNILRMVHDNGDVSMVVLGEGYTVSFSEDTAR